MKSLPFIMVIAVLSLGSYVASAEAMAETRIVHLGKKYSKVELDAVCAREGGSAYGAAQDIYGCAKGSNIVVCNADGTCAGYMWLSTVPATDDADHAPIKDWRGNAELVLQMPVTLPKAGLDSDPGTAQ